MYFISFFLFSFHFWVCTGYANGVYIKCSSKFLSGIALIHVSGDFFPGKVGNVSVPSGFAGFRFMRCAATGHYKFCCNVRPCASGEFNNVSARARARLLVPP